MVTRTKSGIISLCILGLVAAVVYGKKWSSGGRMNVVKMAISSHWRTLHPGLQHSLAGDLVLSNQFESLVGMDDHGMIVPLAAKAWKVDSNSKKFEFSVDTSRKYSDGSKLCARDFKESWEKALKLDPKSANSSLLDILYKVDGFSEFSKVGTLSGLEVVGDETLVIHFSTPFRMALDHLQGNRFSAYKEVNGKFIGTGKYVITEEGTDRLKMTPQSQYAQELLPIELSFMSQSEIEKKLSSGDLDVMPYGSGSQMDLGVLREKNIQIVSGQDALHLTMALNTQSKSLFREQKFRQALQSLVYTKMNSGYLLWDARFFRSDAQPYLEAQMGRLLPAEEKGLVELGQPNQQELIAQTKKRPLKVLTTDLTGKYWSFLEEMGLTVDKSYLPVDVKTFFDQMYKINDSDLMVSAFSIANGDPDGIYHRLGRNGAIVAPMSRSQLVEDLLESGRKIIDFSQVHAHYEKVSRAMLREVPFVHLGFAKAVSLLRSDRVVLNANELRRNQGHFDVFKEIK